MSASAPPNIIADAKAFTARWQTYFASTCPELAIVPKDWVFLTDGVNRQIYWINTQTGKLTSTHPHFGKLPRDWVLRVYRNEAGDEGWKCRYLNTMTGEVTREDPRFSSSVLRQQSSEIAKGMRISASTMRNTGQDLRELYRQPIGKRSDRENFQVVKTLDDGKGALGGMNDGVHVVVMKMNGKLYVEKRFRREQFFHAKDEIKMIHKLKHSALTFYTGAFIDEQKGIASIYLEFCDRGSLSDMIDQYYKRPGEMIPEPFIWHALIGLADGLAYMQTGGEGARNWIPILHRDLKPDNVLLRSRSTAGSSKYFYCVLSDFGLAVEEPESRNQILQYKCGSKGYWAPELLYDPYPKLKVTSAHIPDYEMKIFPKNGKHSLHSDVYSLGLVIYNLCYPAKKGFKHVRSSIPVEYKNLDEQQYYQGIVSRTFNFDLNEYGEGEVDGNGEEYSDYLEKAIKTAVEKKVRNRSDAEGLLKVVKKLNGKSGFSSMESAREWPLPGWCTRVHTYHT